jgi:F-type H+-transporting ATPase subunit a
MKKRYVIYGCVVALLALMFTAWSPVLPFVQVPGEVWPSIHWPDGSFLYGPFSSGLTNTAFATFLVFFIVLGLGLSLRARSRTADEIPTGFYNVIEMIIEGAYDYVVSTSGTKWAKAFFPFFMTFVLWILVANWMELVPGVDSIGYIEDFSLHGPQAKAAHAADAAYGEEVDSHGEEVEADSHGVDTAIFGENQVVVNGACRQNVGPLIFLTAPKNCTVYASDGSVANGSDAKWQMVPYVRAAATDLNFTFALALISVIMTQYFGMKANGMKYWSKFFTWNTEKILESPLGVMDTVVGLLEFVSEMFKIVSFAFRLFGAIFAGQILLFVIGSLLPAGNIVFYFLEFAVGALQAGILALLTLIFMTGAVQEPHH